MNHFFLKNRRRIYYPLQTDKPTSWSSLDNPVSIAQVDQLPDIEFIIIYKKPTVGELVQLSNGKRVYQFTTDNKSFFGLTRKKRVSQAVEHPDKLVLQLLTLVEGFLFSENVFIAVVSWIWRPFSFHLLYCIDTRFVFIVFFCVRFWK